MQPEISIHRRVTRRFWREVDRMFRALSPRGQTCPLSSGQSLRPVFIIGSGRSGTTLLRRLLVAGGELQIAPEMHGTAPFIRDFQRASHCPWGVLCRSAWAQIAFRNDWADWGISRKELMRALKAIPIERRSASGILDAIHRLYASKHGGARWGDKTPLNTESLELIERVFPNALYVHVLRDGVDVAGSIVRTGMIDDLEQAAELWVNRTQKALELQSRIPNRCVEVRYEELVTTPGKVMSGLCEFLGLKWDDNFLDRTDHIKDMGDVNRHAWHDAVHKPVNRDALGKARQNLSPENRQTLAALLNETLTATGYQPL